MFRQNGSFFLGVKAQHLHTWKMQVSLCLPSCHAQCQSGWNFELQSTKRSHISRIHVFLLDLGLGLREVEIHLSKNTLFDVYW